MARLFHLSTLALTAALAAAAAPTEPDALLPFKTVLVSANLRGASDKAGRLLPSLLPKNPNTTGTNTPPQPTQPQQPAVDPLGPTDTPTAMPPVAPAPEGNGDGDVPHVPVPVSVTSSTTVTMDDGSALTVKCTDDVCTACATDAQGQDLGCQPIECDEDGECEVKEPEVEVEVEAPEVKPEVKPKKRAEEKEDPSEEDGNNKGN